MRDLIIIGAGPAGLAAAIYAARAELDYVLIEENFVNGGQIIDTYEIDNYPGLPGLSGMDLAQKMADHAEKLGAEVVNAAVEGLELEGEVKKVLTDEGVFEAKTVIIASGAAHSHLGVPGEEALAGRGVSYCATCDGAFYRGKTTVVVGGGDVAVEDAIFLARGCEKVYVVHRRDELRAVKTLQTALFALPNVEMVWDSNLKTINEGIGEDGKGTGKVASVIVVNKNDGAERIIDADGVFIAVGITPRSGFVGAGIKTNDGGYILADETCETSISGVFAAGDVRAKQLRQVVTAVADGANAVTSAQRYLVEHA
ncbi:MAG: FAD-dependent oxidoreductase [Eubacteriales bacterium]|nr:FAD-dependent oxidoreductase [Eubacteriales bacterium]